MKTLGWSIGAVGALVAACSGSTASVSSDQAATDLASAYCNKINMCAPVEIKIAFGTVDACITAAKKSTAVDIAAPMTSFTPDRAEACVSAANAASCADILAGINPADCAPKPGTIAVGAACGNDSQCVSAFCSVPAGKTCGQCATAPAAGAACVNSRCPQEFVCISGDTAASNTCVKPATAGQACSATQPCAGALACYQQKCVSGGEAGADCDPAGMTAPPCSFLSGAACDASTKKCAELTLAAPGGACGVVNSKFVLCQAGNYCKTAGSTAFMGTCAPQAAEGGGCDTDPAKGPSCLAPAKCDTGVCKVANPANCK
jgi:hypothetical protein